MLQDIPPEDRCDETRDLDLAGEDQWKKTLGVHWCAEDDQFRFKVKELNGGNTKRSVLSRASAVFDPLGILSPFTIRAKCIIQKIWLGGWDWDEAITDGELLTEWHCWQQELRDMDCVRVSRCYRPDNRAVVKCQLHVFGDASENAFGVVAYLRFELEDGTVHCSFVMSKVRVAPIKQLSIPRLELQAAVMAVRVADAVKTEHDTAIDETVFWSDSSTVIQWIHSESRRYNTFVANRISEIQDSSGDPVATRAGFPESGRHLQPRLRRNGAGARRRLGSRSRLPVARPGRLASCAARPDGPPRRRGDSRTESDSVCHGLGGAGHKPQPVLIMAETATRDSMDAPFRPQQPHQGGRGSTNGTTDRSGAA